MSARSRERTISTEVDQDVRDAVRVLVHVEPSFADLTRATAEARAKLRICRKTLEAVSESRSVVRSNDEATLSVFDGLGMSPDGRRDDREARGHRLTKHNGKAVGTRGEDEHVGLGVETKKLRREWLHASINEHSVTSRHVPPRDEV